MPFYLSRRAEQWFKAIRPDMDVDFDIYHLCFLAGIRAGKKLKLDSSEVKELVDYFPSGYRARQKEILAHFLAAELRFHGLDDSDRERVHHFIGTRIDPNTPSGLSSSGQSEMNQYSWGGFEVIAEWFGDRPHHLEAFLPRLVDMLGSDRFTP